VGTSPSARCGGNGWPADLSTVSISANKFNLLDLSSFIVPTRRLATSPGDPGYNKRWDLAPGSVAGKHINLLDMSAALTIPQGYPPMLNGARAYGATCPP
jgi:hypothetical protein